MSQIHDNTSSYKKGYSTYPNRAKRMNIQGKGVVQLVVDTSGNPKSLFVV